jgi:hypothetical protein
MKLGMVFYYLTEEFGINSAVEFIELILDEHEKDGNPLIEIAEANLVNFVKDLESSNHDVPRTMDKITKEGNPYAYDAYYARKMTKRLRLTENSVFMNGRLFPLDRNFKFYVVNTYSNHLRYLQEKVVFYY